MNKTEKWKIFRTITSIILIAVIAVGIEYLLRGTTAYVFLPGVYLIIGLSFLLIGAISLKKLLALRKIGKINNPDERLLKLIELERKTTGSKRRSNSGSATKTQNKARLILKGQIYLLMASTYNEKGDYEMALSMCEKTSALQPILDENVPGSVMTIRELNLIDKVGCLIFLNRLEEAEISLMPLLSKTFQNKLEQCTIDSACLFLTIRQADVNRARQLIAQMTTYIEALDKKCPGFGILFEFRLHEAMTDRLEGKYNDATIKLEYILQNCKHYGVLRLAGLELTALESQTAPQSITNA